MFDVKIDDRQVMDFAKKSPRRAEWALAEALKTVGGHLRKKIKAQIQSGKGWPPLSPSTIKRKQKRSGRAGSIAFRTKPLEIFGRMVSFRFSRSRKYRTIRVRVGFFNTKGWFKKSMGVGAATIARLHETGKKSPKYGQRPIRQMIGPVWRAERENIPRYVEKKFFQIFFSKRRPGLKL